MGLFDKLRERLAPSAPTQGRTTQGHGTPSAHASTGHGARRPGGAAAKDPDEAAVERYRYMLRTAPPETIEQAHAEAFAKLTPEQRCKVLADVSAELPTAERATSDDPRSLARMATRAEMRNPGAMERTLGGGRAAGMGMGGMIAGTLLASVAGAFIGTAIADAFFDDEMAGDMGGEELAAEDQGMEDPGTVEGADFGGDFGGDF